MKLLKEKDISLTLIGGKENTVRAVEAARKSGAKIEYKSWVQFDELPGLSAFYQDASGRIFHTYSSYARGPEPLIGTLMILDRAPRGRNEEGTMDFVRRHDEYEGARKAACCHAEPA